MAAGAAFGFCLVCIGVIAKSHGAENTVWTKATAAEIYNMNQKSHAIETKIEPQPGQLFAYVRYGCGDCMAVSKDLETAVKNSGLDFAGWYSIRTDLGKSLLEKYPVTMVHMLVWLDADGWAETCDPALKLDDGSVKINADAIEIFFQKIKYIIRQFSHDSSPNSLCSTYSAMTCPTKIWASCILGVILDGTFTTYSHNSSSSGTS